MWPVGWQWTTTPEIKRQHAWQNYIIRSYCLADISFFFHFPSISFFLLSFTHVDLFPCPAQSTLFLPRPTRSPLAILRHNHLKACFIHLQYENFTYKWMLLSKPASNMLEMGGYLIPILFANGVNLNKQPAVTKVLRRWHRFYFFPEIRSHGEHQKGRSFASVQLYVGIMVDTVSAKVTTFFHHVKGHPLFSSVLHLHHEGTGTQHKVGQPLRLSILCSLSHSNPHF